MELQPRDPAPERGGLPPPFTSSAWFRGYAECAPSVRETGECRLARFKSQAQATGGGKNGLWRAAAVSALPQDKSAVWG